MQVESNVKPEDKFVLENYVDGKIDIVFFDNIQEVTKEEYEGEEVVSKTVYNYDIYRITRIDREGLKDDIEQNYNTYLERAKKEEYETLASEVRAKRDKLLAETDKYVLEDFPITDEEKEKYKKYRNALREIPEQEGFPHTISWPTI